MSQYIYTDMASELHIKINLKIHVQSIMTNRKQLKEQEVDIIGLIGWSYY